MGGCRLSYLYRVASSASPREDRDRDERLEIRGCSSRFDTTSAVTFALGQSMAKGNIRIFVSAEKKTAHRLYSKDLLFLHDYR